MREVVAIKCATKASLNRISTENLLTEIELLKTLRHEHIVELKDFQVRVRNTTTRVSGLQCCHRAQTVTTWK